MSTTTARLDAFTDAAFAFAVSLMVVGGAGFLDYDGLTRVIGAIPSFVIGFAIIAMFWWGHVRWRGHRGEGGFMSTGLTFALILTVLIYVHPLRAMSASFAAFLTGGPNPYPGKLAELFRIYGVGFVVMAALMLALFAEARSDAASRRAVDGEIGVWALLVVTGLVSVLMTFSRTLAPYSPTIYATLPITTTLFVRLWPWDPSEPEA